MREKQGDFLTLAIAAAKVESWPEWTRRGIRDALIAYELDEPGISDESRELLASMPEEKRRAYERVLSISVFLDEEREKRREDCEKGPAGT